MVGLIGFDTATEQLYHRQVRHLQLHGCRGPREDRAAEVVHHTRNRPSWIRWRMCADGAKAPANRFGYSNCFNAIWRIGRDEGLQTFTRGLTPNVVRSIIMNVGQIATYSAVKHELLNNPAIGLTDGLPTHFLASFVAGTVATTACAPADVLKSRIQNAVAVDGVKPSLSRIISDSLRKEGPGFLMRGWLPAWVRLTPYTVLAFVFMEQLQRFIGLSKEGPKREEPMALSKART
jgi:solute carrier family 25 (mitochondrial dicarboxylate transporter), member 10